MCKAKEARKSTASTRFRRNLAGVIYTLMIDSMIMIALIVKVF